MGRSPFRSSPRFALLATVAGLGLVAAGCGSSSSSSSSGSTSTGSASSKPANSKVTGKKIAYVEIFLQAPVEVRVNDVFKMAASKAGWTVNTTDAKGDGQTVSQQMQAAVNSGVDAIITTAEPSLIRAPLLAAQKKNIPVISVGGENTHGLDNLISGVYTEDDTKLSEALGKKLCADTKKGSNIAILRFDLFYSGKIRGDVIKKMATGCGLHVVAEPATEQTFSSAQQKTSATLSAHPDLAAIVPVYDTFTAGAVQAIKSAKKPTKVYSYYADGVNNPLMRANKSIVALTDTTHAYGATYAVDRLLAHFAKGTPIPKKPPAGLITYKIITQADIPPAGQDGPLPLSDYLNKFAPKWASQYGIGG